MLHIQIIMPISKSCDMFLELELNGWPLTLGSEYCKSAVFPGY